jgi:hypothetical protein
VNAQVNSGEGSNGGSRGTLIGTCCAWDAELAAGHSNLPLATVKGGTAVAGRQAAWNSVTATTATTAQRLRHWLDGGDV